MPQTSRGNKATYFNMITLPHQPKYSHFHVLVLLNQIGLHLLSHLKDGEQIQRQTEPHSGKNSCCFGHTIQPHVQTSPKKPCDSEGRDVQFQMEVIQFQLCLTNKYTPRLNIGSMTRNTKVQSTFW